MKYVTDEGSAYYFSYQALREDYYKFRSMTNKEFVDNALDILHFCCVVGCFKELSAESVLIDNGIIHELVHLLVEDTKEEAIYRIDKTRETFNAIMELA